MRLYRLLLRLFPASFRRRFGDDMAEVFADRQRTAKAHGTRAELALWLRTIADMTAHGAAERRASRRWGAGSSSMFESIAHDVRHAIRDFRRRPGFTAIALVTLALGVGANVAIFSVVYAVLLRSRPYPDVGRVVQVYETFRPRFDHGVVSPANFFDWAAANEVFESLAAFQPGSAALTGAGEPMQVRTASVSGGFFTVLGRQAQLGRTLGPADVDAAARVVVLSHALWRSRFGSNAGVVGTDITIDGNRWTVVGVMPPEVDFPHERDLWRPLVLTERERSGRGSFFLGAAARLSSGVSLRQAQTSMDSVAARLALAYPKTNANRGVLLIPLHEDEVARVKDSLALLQGVATLVLVIACVNIANLLLASAASRERELAVRAAVGASRARLIRQLLTESVLLSLSGTALGVLLAAWGVKALVALSPQGLPHMDAIGLSWPALAFAVVVAIATGVIFGFAPAWQSSRQVGAGALREGARSARGGFTFLPAQRLRGGLVVVEVALALVLLSGAGLLVRSFWLLNGQPTGFSAANILTVQLSLPPARYPDAAARRIFFAALLERLNGSPGVDSAAASNALPFSQWEYMSNFTLEDRVPLPTDDGASSRVVTDRYFATLSVPVLKGRTFLSTDTSTSERVAVVDDAFVREFSPDREILGRHISTAAGDPPIRIVGVVGGTKHRGLNIAEVSTYFLPLAQRAAPSMTVAVKTTGAPLSFAARLRSVVRELDADLPVQQMATFDGLIAKSVAERRFYMLLLSLFAGLAVVLALVGIYGVMSYTVGLRRRELGIRLALGAQYRRVLMLVLAQGLRVVAIGVLCGVGGAWLLTRFVASQLFTITPHDPMTLVAVTAGLAAVAALACWIPARRTAAVDPVEALRAE